jgi:hypothetical protein
VQNRDVSTLAKQYLDELRRNEIPEKAALIFSIAGAVHCCRVQNFFMVCIYIVM